MFTDGRDSIGCRNKCTHPSMDVEYYWSATRKEQTKEWSSQTKQRKTKNKGFSYTVAKVSKNGQ